MSTLSQKQKSLIDIYISACYRTKKLRSQQNLLGKIDGCAERLHAEKLEQEKSYQREKIFSKLPSGFPAPYALGNYNKFIAHSLENTSFSDVIMQIITRKGLNPSDVYHKAGLDRRLFSKIRSNKGYKPAKKTVLALCIGMELTLEESKELLEYCGFCFSNKILSDVITECFIIHSNYDIVEINRTLHAYKQPTLL